MCDHRASKPDGHHLVDCRNGDAKPNLNQTVGGGTVSKVGAHTKFIHFILNSGESHSGAVFCN